MNFKTCAKIEARWGHWYELIHIYLLGVCVLFLCSLSDNICQTMNMCVIWNMWAYIFRCITLGNKILGNRWPCNSYLNCIIFLSRTISTPTVASFHNVKNVNICYKNLTVKNNCSQHATWSLQTFVMRQIIQEKVYTTINYPAKLMTHDFYLFY